MIVAALLEFAIVLILNSGIIASNHINDQDMENKQAWASDSTPHNKKSLLEKIDYVCFLLFPIVYVLFNVIYFSHYTLV